MVVHTDSLRLVHMGQFILQVNFGREDRLKLHRKERFRGMRGGLAQKQHTGLRCVQQSRLVLSFQPVCIHDHTLIHLYAV